MQSLRDVETRLQEWRERFCQSQLERPEKSAILVYQDFFSLLHELKSSLHLSPSQAIKNLIPLVERIDKDLRKLAYDELELPPEQNNGMRKVALELKSLEPLEVFLAQAMPGATAIQKPELPIFKHPFPWEGLARARATSTQRHGYVNYVRNDTVNLRELMVFDTNRLEEVRRFNGILIIRQLSPMAPSGSDLKLSTKQVAAFPPGIQIPDPWARF